MASILTPTQNPVGTPPEDERQFARGLAIVPPEVPALHLLLQLEDSLERSRKREALWLSVVVHLAVVLFLVTSPKLFPGWSPVLIPTAADLMKNQNLTYLDLPPDMQKPPKTPPPDTKILSDKNRQAMSRTPTVDRKTLEELRRAGPPAPQVPSGAQAQATPPGESQQAPPNQGQQTAENMQPVQDPKLALPQQGSPQQKPAVDFRAMMTPGQSIDQAARQVANSRTSPGVGFGGSVGGDYGSGRGGTAARVQGNLEVLSDTQGVDFGPYLSRVLQAVRMNWYNLIPEAARAPMLERGKVSIEFVILKDGRVAGMKIIGPSGDISLDRAAWGGITASTPFSPLPGEFHGPYLALRFHFYYNPAKGDLD